MNCEQCFRKCDNAYLCGPCQTQLKAMLVDFPQWYEWLADTALKRTRGGDGGRVPHSDSQPALYDGDTEKGRKTKQGQASELLSAVRNMLTTTVRDLCEQRGVHVPFTGREQTCRRICDYLATHVATIAISDGAGETYREVRDAREQIEHIVNKPKPQQPCGPCPSIDRNGTLCGLRLTIKDGATEVTCPRCKTVHNVKELKEKLSAEIDYYQLTRSELLSAMAWLDEPIAKQTLSDWINGKHLASRGENAEGKPLYKLGDLRQLRETRPRRTRLKATA